MNILHDLIDGKMNIRKAILWAFAVYVMAIIAGMLWHTYDAYVAVTEYTKAHPEIASPICSLSAKEKGEEQ